MNGIVSQSFLPVTTFADKECTFACKGAINEALRQNGLNEQILSCMLEINKAHCNR